ncbi:ABC transporter ATP-binding protein [Sporosarcina ureilytica]|uniref:Spermidine/putrescine import ATP-binding protein PotA n=1 Tax=Sporosarcina ureilytica TaxID=298596 RepID=A0A1D8JGV4_9BACL|nr:ABC transporter ATP-binding protein [Sporosarcina ureilytica]AOV07945.1 ABC transporter ATP-binding protein [Sporosarcina ureilytica]
MALGNSLSVINATKYYKKFKAVDNVNLTVNKGEFITILGPSGSGKTSLLKLIAGFEELSGGSILLNNLDITKKKPFEREIGMLFQNYALFPHMNVFDNIAYPLRLRKFSKDAVRDKVQNILKLVHLEEYRSRYPEQLSGGQQQRVALARAIVFTPPLLLLDEPLGALDKNLRKQMQLEIMKIQAILGITTISVTHDQEEALSMSDRICVMNKGKIEQIDSPENLYNRPKNRFVAEFIGDINLIKGHVINVIDKIAKVKIKDDLVIDVKIENANTVLKGESMLIAIRPENVQIAQVQSQFDNTILAEVQNTIYVGDSVVVNTKTLTSEEIMVKIPVYMHEIISNGQIIRLGWNSKDASLVFDETPT